MPTSADDAAVFRIEARVTLALGALGLDVALDTRAPALAISGPSGAGKSTCLRILAGLERRATGRVVIAEETWQDSTRRVFVPPWSRRVGWVPQDALLFPHLTVLSNLAYARVADRTEIDRVAKLVSAEHLLDRWPRNLSGGERQRVALGRALLARPRLLLLDEPFAALDRALRVELAERLRSYCRDRSLPLVLVTHDPADAAALADEAYEIRAGKVVAVV